MNRPDISFTVRFDCSGETVEVRLRDLMDRVIDFLENYGEAPILSRRFCSVIGSGDGVSKLSRLLDAVGYPRDPRGLFSEVLHRLESASCGEELRVKIGNVIILKRIS